MTDLRLAWLGDDFTGAAAVMEVLTFAGLPSVLFTEPPSSALMARFADCAAVGLATTARAQGPAWMAEHLPPLFAALDALQPQILHYKICSTFDSARIWARSARPSRRGCRCARPGPCPC